MTYKEALLFVGKCLTLGIHPERTSDVRQEIRSGKIVWEQIVQLSSGQFVLPALFIRLKKASLLEELPFDLVEYMEYLADRNRERNLQILNQIRDIVTLLNSHGIVPIFLKGTAHLLLPLYEDIAERMVGDIDFLVEESEMLKAAELLIEVGYIPRSKFNPELIKIIKHYPRLTNFNYPSSVEVHRQVIRPPHDKLFKSSEIIRDKQKISGQWEVYVPSTEHLIIHNTLNVQVNDNAYLYGTAYLRQMVDLLLLSSRDNPQKVLKGYARFPNHSNAYLAATSIVFNNSAGIKYNNSRRVRLFLKRFNFFLQHPGFHSAYKSTIYILMRLLRYISLPLQSIYKKDIRVLLWSRISDPKWYKAHVLSYWDHFRPKPY
jgi:hypothetical protein